MNGHRSKPLSICYRVNSPTVEVCDQMFSRVSMSSHCSRFFHMVPFVSSGSSQSFRRLEAMEQRLLALEEVLMSEPIESLREANVGLRADRADLLCF